MPDYYPMLREGILRDSYPHTDLVGTCALLYTSGRYDLDLVLCTRCGPHLKPQAISIAI